MIDEIPEEVFDYINDQDNDTISKIINEQFKDFVNEKLSRFIIENSSEFKDLFERGPIDNPSLFGLVICYADINRLVFKDYNDESRDQQIDRIHEKKKN